MQKRRRSSTEGSMGTWSQMPIPGMTPWMGYAGHCAGQKRQELSRPLLEGFWACARASGIVYTLVDPTDEEMQEMEREYMQRTKRQTA